MHFTKMQGLGNDYIYLDCLTDPAAFPEDPAALAARLADRHFGIGGDGLVLIFPSNSADCRMRMFNADGSEGKMCGNAIRCVGKYVRDHGIIDKTSLTVETAAGIRELTLFPGGDGKVESVRVDMGTARLTRLPSLPGNASVTIPAAVFEPFYENPPVTIPCDAALPKTIRKCTAHAVLVDVGNPHAVLFTDAEISDLSLAVLGPILESHPAFGERVNVEFARCTAPTELDMRVYERGSGETLACGTGACAVCAAAVHLGLCPPDTPLSVSLRGGILTVTVSASLAVTMTGPAVTVFEGDV